MKKTIQVENTQPGIWLDSDLTFTQVPGWLGHTTQDLKLSIMKPFDNHEGKRPAILWFCSGGWMNVDHNVHLPNLVDFVRKGFVVASAEYRNFNQGKWPAQLEDGKSAVRYLKANAEKLGIDPTKIIAMGESAGGHMASMLGVTNSIRKFDQGQYLEQNSNVAMSIPWYGVTNFKTARDGSKSNDFDFVYEQTLGGSMDNDPKLAENADPNHFVSNKTVPFLILHGTNDEVVPIKDSNDFYENLIKHHVSADLYEIAGAAHMDEKFMQPGIEEIILEFIKKFKIIFIF